MLESALLFTVLAIINATVPVGNGQVNVPLQVTPVGEASSSAAATAAPAANVAGVTIDNATLTAIITPVVAAIGGLVYKNKKDSDKEDTRSNTMADTQLMQTRSLQETDKADMIFKDALVKHLENPTPETKEKLKELAITSKQNYEAYYENLQPQPLDYSKDEVVRKLSAVQKRSTD